mmetsp:Transcript_43004/g.48083  ORF Transcript_43004/g.48083 Transcript_43004/m.48083 type:complete len:320 (+) Transcript_43004:123-1082(+)
MMISSMLMMISKRFPLLLPYGFMCLRAHLGLYILFRYLLPVPRTSTSPTTTTTTTPVAPPWKQSPSLTAHRMVAFCAMIHWTYLGFRHIRSFDYNSDSTSNATIFIPAGFDLAQVVMGALVCWDIPSSVVGGSGPTDLMMHLHHGGMLLVVSCVLLGKVGTHVAPIFLGVIEVSSIPLQLVDLFHPTKSPHWHKYINDNDNDNDNDNHYDDDDNNIQSQDFSDASSTPSVARKKGLYRVERMNEGGTSPSPLIDDDDSTTPIPVPPSAVASSRRRLSSSVTTMSTTTPRTSSSSTPSRAAAIPMTTEEEECTDDYRRIM